MLKSLEEALSTLGVSFNSSSEWSKVKVTSILACGSGHYSRGMLTSLPSRLLLSICAMLYFAYPPLLTFPSYLMITTISVFLSS